MAFIGRSFVVLFAFLVASLAAAFVLEIGILVPFWRDAIATDIDQGFFKVMVGFGFFFISVLSLLPAMIVIALAEAFRLRSVLFYAAAGGLEALALCYSFGFTYRPSDGAISPFMQAFAASGIAAGLVYWLIAGRNAGRWCERQSAPDRPSV
jgi:hypothetical protein